MRELNLIEQTNVSGGFYEFIAGVMGATHGYDRKSTYLLVGAIDAVICPLYCLYLGENAVASIIVGGPVGFALGAGLAYFGYSLVSSPAAATE